MTPRKKPGVAFWATVGLVVVLVAYPLSFGPANYVAYQLNGRENGTFAASYTVVYFSFVIKNHCCLDLDTARNRESR